MSQLRNAATGRAPLHVLEVIGNAIVGGMETWVEKLIEHMPRTQVRFTAVCPADGAFADRLRALGVDVHMMSMADSPPWDSIQATAALVRFTDVDLLHAHLPRAHVLAGIVGRLTSRPVLATVHGRQPTVLDLEVHRLVDSHVSTVCWPSYYSALGLGVSAERLSCETNGVDLHAFRPQRRGASALRSALGLAPQAAVVGFVGRLSPEKGPDVFVRMVQRLPPDVHGVVIGDGPMRAQLGQLGEALGLQQRLHLLGLREDVANLYKELDVVVSSSHSEAMPLALMEAMASGLPVVATRVGGVPALIEQGRSGWLVAPGDFDDMAGRCAALVADPALRRRMGECGRQRAEARFDLADSVAAVGRLMQRLVHGDDAMALAMPPAARATA
ncbi:MULTISPECIES: glycosyltransferase [unclassified Roseateles]|uniref:glycosyltransferase n=1 Tax=unclassified Roseateles TaxID=2626991 RepID=UPI0006FBA3E4|nr:MULTISPECIES: glycosyltransferase [unclassified Roseateles]KQW43266.1 hypothetical protein ASC81_15825 [Pelomonas sp. Root405]KRA71004.1 hypothetical protein ASD88_14350 [Pelomonas sp. Root662]